MSSTTEPTESRVRTYGNWRRPRSRGLLGMQLPATILLLAALMTAFVLMALTLYLPALIVAVSAVVVVWALSTTDKHDVSVATKLRTRTRWWAARSRGENLYRSGPLGRSLWGTHQLPGLLASTRLSEHRDAYDRPFALLYSPTTSTATVVIEAEPEGSALVDADQVDRWVAQYGNWLAALGENPSVVAASVTIEAEPDSGSSLRNELDERLQPDTASPFSLQVAKEILLSYPTGATRVTAYMAVTVRTTSVTGRRRKLEDVAIDLAAQMPGLTQSLEATGLAAAVPVSAQRLCEVVRVAYDPVVSEVIDQARARGESLEMSWPDVGPSAHQANWASYQHDSGYSQTWQMSIAPRGHVQSSVLRRLLAPHPDIARKRVTLMYRPIDPGRAAAIVEADRATTRYRAGARRADIASSRDLTEVAAADRTAQEEAEGAALLHFGMLVTATVTDPEMIRRAAEAVNGLAATARLRLRPAYGSQAAAFAAALPLGQLLNRQLAAPTQMSWDLS